MPTPADETLSLLIYAVSLLAIVLVWEWRSRHTR